MNVTNICSKVHIKTILKSQNRKYDKINNNLTSKMSYLKKPECYSVDMSVNFFLILSPISMHFKLVISDCMVLFYPHVQQLWAPLGWL